MKGKITWLAYSTFILIGIVFTIAGVVMKEIATEYKVDTSSVGYALTFFTIGTSLAIFASGYILHKISLKKLLNFSYLLGIIGITALFFSYNLIVFGIVMFFLGLAFGLLVSLSNFLIVSSYNEEERRGKLSILNFFYGVGSILCPVFAGLMIKANINWHFIYLITILPIAVLIITSNFIDFSKIREDKGEEHNAKAKFSLNIVLIGTGLFLYVISEVIFTSWVVTYFRDVLHFEAALAALGLTFFWIFMSAGRLLSGIISNGIKLDKMILVSEIVAFIMIGLLLILRQPVMIFVVISMAGLAYSALYPSILTYGTNQVKNVPPSIVTFFITMGACGNLASYPISSFIKQNLDMDRVLIAVPIFMMLSIVSISTVMFRTRKIQKV